MRFRIVGDGGPCHLRDVSRFGRALVSGDPEVCGGFAGGRGMVTVVRVPGRLDVMGGIADYSGSVVCEGLLAPAAVLGLQARRDRQVRIRSVGLEREGLAPDFDMPLDEFGSGGRLADYGVVAAQFKRDPATSWAAYLAGTLYVLLREKVIPRLAHGFNLVLRSDVPMGAGIASSAAIEVAAMHAINTVLDLGLPGLEVARLCQLVENRVVGAPCGIMDQVVTAMGTEDHLLAIRCQPGEVLKAIRLPARCAVAGIHSQVRHSIGGSRYRDVRVGAFMGHRILLDLLGAKPPEDPWRGYLCNLGPREYRERFAAHVPAFMRGRDFLTAYGGTVDRVTQVDPDKTYRIRSRAEHPIYENARVARFIECLERAADTGDDKDLVRAGRLMYASHWSYRVRCGLDSPETFLLVQLARGIGVRGGVYGAKITGGGAGGTVAILGRADALEEVVQRIAEGYEAATGIRPAVFIGSSPGAIEFGSRRYAPT